jgi:hypothetical protein
MAVDRKDKGYGCLFAASAAIFLLVLLSPLIPSVRGSPNLGERAFVGLFLIVPLFSWYWWSSDQPLSPEEDGEGDGRSGTFARLRRWFRLNLRTVWAITVVLTVASVLAIRWFGDAPEDPRRVALRKAIAQRSSEERVAIMSEYFAACEKGGREFATNLNPSQAEIERQGQALSEACRRIAEAHHISLEELHAIGDGTLERPPTFVQRNGFELFVLYFTPLVILNTPLYWLLAVILFGSWAGYQDEDREYYSVPKSERICYLRMNLYQMLCAVVLLPEFWLLAQCMTR